MPVVTSWSGSGEAGSEDYVVVSRQAAVVVDGAGFPKSLRMGCVHSVAWYAQALATSFHGWLVDAAVSMREALSRAISDVVSQHQERCELAAGSPSAAVACWRLGKTHLEYLVLCDCSVLLLDRAGSGREITDRRVDERVEPQLQAAKESLAGTSDVAGQLLAVRRAAVKAARNVPGVGAARISRRRPGMR
jgi:hypothetical protein